MSTMHVGFTGTQVGMTQAQEDLVWSWLLRLADAVIGHHGDCVGSDEDFHRIGRAIGIGLRIHPPTDESRRAFCEGADVTYPAKPYLARNRDIARTCSVLLATPRQAGEVLRSGTWSTVRAARRLGRGVVVFHPDGSITAL